MINLRTARFRADLLNETRDFFRGRGFLETDTPLLAEKVIPETTIELFSSRFSNPYGEDRELFLLPSPEYYLKQVLKEFPETPLFQLAKAFRNREQTGALHNIEFTMLEWYRPDYDYHETEAETRDLLQRLWEFSGLNPPGFGRISMEEAFRNIGGIELAPLCGNSEALKKTALELGISCSKGDSWNDVFQRIFISLIEPGLPTDEPLFVYDYPADIACLARRREGTPWRERWELYWKGVELANCYNEMVDPREVHDFFENEAEEKAAAAAVPVTPDREFYHTFESPYPASSGAALGFDRLVMLLGGSGSIQDVIYFPFTP